VLTLQKADSSEIISKPVEGRPLEELLAKEWLLTNERGGYASSTIVGCNTRRYHGLLIGSPNPLANRIVGLANCLEMVIFDGSGALCDKSQGGGGPVFDLSTFEFQGKFAPEGFHHIKRFRRDTGVHFDYELGGLQLTKSIYILRDADAAVLVYDFANAGESVSGKRTKTSKLDKSIEFVVRPFIGLRDFHSLQKSYAHLRSSVTDGALLVYHDVPGSCELLLNCPSMGFRKDPQWWFNFLYRSDRERGQDFSEDLWSPGFYKYRLDSAATIVLRASLKAPVARKGLVLPGADRQEPKIITSENRRTPEEPSEPDIDAVRKSLRLHQEDIRRKAKGMNHRSRTGPGDKRYEMLCLAADQFIAKRQAQDEQRSTVLAGFPWFGDWGRDAFISLAGLLLSTGRLDDARSVLTTFAAAVDDGMIPNRFDDYSSTAYFNSIDASLWFINAAFQYLKASGDSKTLTQQLLPAIRWIVDSYQKGTRFGIHADGDGLITGGSEETQLTWMDAKYAGVTFTPRYGKAVEINALWYNSLCQLAQFYADRDMKTADRFRSMADKVAGGFSALFWNEAAGCLNDCILPDGSVDVSLRPNQIFAVSLPFSALSIGRQRCVVDVVERNLLTPYGLRTLNMENSRYKGRYTGPQQERDEAYHQGTVWPFLLGPFVEAYLKVNEFSRKSKKQAAEFIGPLLEHLTEDACLGQISEIFDGDAPHQPRGCIAQAWSVAELIRAYRLVNS
jgi:glycogen debranching enzyme